MDENEVNLYAAKGLLSELEPETLEKVKEFMKTTKVEVKLLESLEAGVGLLAMSILALEMALELD